MDEDELKIYYPEGYVACPYYMGHICMDGRRLGEEPVYNEEWQTCHDGVVRRKTWTCGECNTTYSVEKEGWFNYCPKCGTKIIKKQE